MTNTTLYLLLSVVWLHWLGDFVLQSHKMSTQKSKSNLWLTYHVTIYSLWGLLFGLQFWGLLWLTHWATDFVTSRMTSELWAKEKVHNFFVVIGLDQAIHLTTIVLLFLWTGAL